MSDHTIVSATTSTESVTLAAGPGRRGVVAARAERAERTRELLERAHAADDPDVRRELLDEVVIINRGVACAVASRYRGRGVAQDDLEQAALEGLVKAVRKFDPTVRPDLLTYAVPTMRGEIQRWFRDQSWMVRPPRRIQELQWRITRSTAELSQVLGREPTRSELAGELECSEEQLAEAVNSFGCFTPPSLDLPVGAPDAGGTLGDLLTSDEPQRDLAAAEARAALAQAARTLTERERQILFMRYFEQLSQTDIGEQLGVTQMQISRLLDRIMRKMRHELDPTGRDDAEAIGTGLGV